MAIPKQVGVIIDSMRFQVFELSLIFISLVLFSTWLLISGWTEEGIFPFVWHECSCEIRVFVIALVLVFIGTAIFERYQNSTVREDNAEQSADLPGIHGEKQQQSKKWRSFLCIGSSPDCLDEPETEAVSVDDFKTEKNNSHEKRN
ncbi:uncharacterized protein LOC129959062 [Argiope bruennichi]|uniref:uncharacterized protein LOC129959062 n=1 Tax=Argiope bruennichi TaxID=94029 RepID=UPI0024946AEC|nr:uncharacterized protein LOC129959062 [Argiope bruennichi]